MSEKILIQFWLHREDATEFSNILKSYNTPLPLSANKFAREVLRKWLAHQRRKATYGTGINPAENSGV